MAPPGGWFDRETVEIARHLGYVFLFSCKVGLTDLTQIPFVYKRNEVLRRMSLEEFQNLLVPVNSFPYKLKQALKFLLHGFIGTKNYIALGHAIKE